jgi:hypothetical protein
MAKEILTIENGIKLGGLIIAFILQYAAIKSDIRDMKTEKHFEIEHLQYQISELKDCCNNKRSERRIVFNDRAAILPNGIEIETER